MAQCGAFAEAQASGHTLIEMSHPAPTATRCINNEMSEMLVCGIFA